MIELILFPFPPKVKLVRDHIRRTTTLIQRPQDVYNPYEQGTTPHINVLNN